MSLWKTKSSKIVYENPWILVREDKVITPSGKDGLYGVVESKSEAVFVVPVDNEGNIYIVQQEHYTTREMAWQCVAGRTDGEPREVAAKRELLEEAGLWAETIKVLAHARTASGVSTFRTNICLAKGLHHDDSRLDKDEVSAIKKISLVKAKEMIFNGEITATESIAALLMVIAYLEKEKTVQ
jgi:8-oxo-dGTP pyrophosphatase MutT (NUDIX family)